MKSPIHGQVASQSANHVSVTYQGIGDGNVLFSPPLALTVRQFRLVSFIADYRARRGKSPCMKEMQAAVWNKSASTVRLDVMACIDKGALVGGSIHTLRPSETFQRIHVSGSAFS